MKGKLSICVGPPDEPQPAPGRSRPAAASNELRLWFCLTDEQPPAPTSSWRTGVVLRRYETAATTFDPDQALRSPVIRDGLATLKRIALPSAEILDVGCGHGAWAQLLARCPAPLSTWRYRGIEVSPELVELCRRHNPDQPFDVGTGEHLPCADQSQDIVLCSGVLTYARDWRRCLRECARVSGQYVTLLRTPVMKHHPTTGCRQTVCSAAGEEEHYLVLFARDELHGELARAGLSIVDWDYTDEVHRVEGLDERLFYLDYLLEVQHDGRWGG